MIRMGIILYSFGGKTMKKSIIKTGAAVLCAALAITTFGATNKVFAYEGETGTTSTAVSTRPAPYDNTLTLEENNISIYEVMSYYNYVRNNYRYFDDETRFEVERDSLSYYLEFLSQQGLITSEEDIAYVMDLAADLRETEYDPSLSLDMNCALINNRGRVVFQTYFRGWDLF